ncbi:MAG: hypothetical protein M1822_008983 [Bathelium mastoideum]|nr:MAG: hypothetical protein M1822_008983 [Bathelium mastoideum]
MLKRQPTDEALSVLMPKRIDNTVTTSNYSLGLIESFCVPVKEACVKAVGRLEQLDLQDDGIALFEDPPKPADIVARLEQIVTRLEKQSHRPTHVRRSGKFFNSFCSFVDRTSSIVKLMLPQSPEYTLTFGMLFLLFEAVVPKKERDDSLLAHIEKIGTQLPLVEFYKSVFPINQMKECVVRLYVYIMKLLDEAIAYYHSVRLGKLVDTIFRAEGKFDVHVKNIEREVQKMHTFKDAGHVAQSDHMMKTISNTGVTGQELLQFEMTRYSRELQDLLFLGDQDIAEDPDACMNRLYRLSLKDHWGNNGILEDLREWSDEDRERLFWAGHCSGNQDSWVTELSVDMINALKPQSLTLLYVFCEQSINAALTPIGLIRKLLVQLLELHPEIAYTNPEIWSVRRTKNAVSFKQLWNIFQQTVERLRNVFVIIDRIEQCEATEEADVVHHLLPTLIKWAATKNNVDVVVTSVSVPPVEVLDLPVFETYIDTSKKATKRQ